MKLQPNGINHLALSTSDMRKTLLYFNDVLGFPLAALYWMHGVKGTIHGFLKINDSSLLAFVYHPKVSPNIQLGKTHPGSMEGTSAKGTMHHLSFNVTSMEGLASLQDRLDAKGIACTKSKPDCYPSSIQFPGPDGMLLEVSCKQDIDEESLWDNEAALAVGIDENDLKKLKQPKAYSNSSSPVKNTPIGEDAGFRMNYPPAKYRTMISLSDEKIFDLTQDHLPPDQKAPFRMRKLRATMTLLSLLMYHAIFSSWRKL
jgi:catechol 2,3-dioxygenase-like lactoylglutathione lyase family enzyme